MGFQCINIRQVPWEVLKTAEAAVFNTSQGTWRMLMHENPCLIPILPGIINMYTLCRAFLLSDLKTLVILGDLVSPDLFYLSF